MKRLNVPFEWIFLYQKKTPSSALKTISPFTTPLYLMAKPAGSRCNLACKYCYYLEKSNLYADNPQEVMSDELLEVFIRDYIAAQTMPQVLFTWHGGETLMRPLSFYKKVIELERKYANGRTIDNCIQTNGTLLTDEWCRFFKENNWLVGLSIDGPQEFHDEYRRNRAGRPSFRQVMHGINLLNRHGVEWNALAVVNDFNADYPLDFYHFFKEIGCHYIQFTPIVERLQPHTDGRTLAAVDEEGPNSGAISLSRFSMNGCATMWATTLFSCSTQRWPTGWVSPPDFVPWPRLVVMRVWWNGTATCTRATTLCFLSTNWATLRAKAFRT